VGSRPGQRGGPPPRVPKRDTVVKEGDALTLGGQALKFHQTPGHTPGVLTTEGITVYDRGTPIRRFSGAEEVSGRTRRSDRDR